MIRGERPDIIRITGMRFWGRHGALAGERDRTQPIDVDLEVSADLGPSIATDRIEDAIDYAQLFACCERIVTSESCALLEALADKILSAVFADERVREAQVRVSKPRLLDGATPQVQLRRAKAP
jgi:dihydroneopterin aldolase